MTYLDKDQVLAMLNTMETSYSRKSVMVRATLSDVGAAIAALPAIPLSQVRSDLERLLALVGKMRDDWAEGDAAVKKALWRDLHTFAGELEARYEILGGVE